MPELKKFYHIKFTAPAPSGENVPVDGGGPFATFAEVKAAAVAHTAGAVCLPPATQFQTAGRIVDEGGVTIGTWEKKVV